MYVLESIFKLYSFRSSRLCGLQTCLRQKNCKNRFSEFKVPTNKVELDAIFNVMVACARRLSGCHDLAQSGVPLSVAIDKRASSTAAISQSHYCPTNSSCPEFQSHDGTVKIVILVLDVCHISFSTDTEKMHNIKEKHQKNLQMVWCHHQNS